MFPLQALLRPVPPPSPTAYLLVVVANVSLHAVIVALNIQPDQNTRAKEDLLLESVHQARNGGLNMQLERY